MAEEISRWLDGHGESISSRRNAGPSGDGLESLISQADALLALMSPGYMGSAPCRRERELAFHEEEYVRGPAGRGPFIHVLQVGQMPYNDAGALQDRTWWNLTDAARRDAELRSLLRALPASGEAADPAADNAAAEPPSFRNRDRELGEMLGALTTPGKHFWLVTAAPQLGKSWFLDRISLAIQEHEPGRWRVRLVDVREKPPLVRTSVEALLGLLLGSGDPETTDEKNLVRLAINLGKAGKFHLCLLDSAELLDSGTARALRTCLSKVHQYVTNAGNLNVRLSLLVATRSGESWTGISKPRLEKYPLTGFTPEDITGVMEKMAARTGHKLDAATLQSYAAVVHGQCEGLPALLYRYLTWIHEERFTELHRLRDDMWFFALTHPYIEEKLLSPGSLFGPGSVPDEQRDGVEMALRMLVPYRLITQSHLSHHADQSAALRSAMEVLGWSVEKLWDAVRKTDLFDRPQSDAWEVVNPPLRRLLSRYWYPTENSRASAHLIAADYVRSWGRRQHNSDQSVALVECLWHHSQFLKDSHTQRPGEKLIKLTREMSLELTESENWSHDEIRQYAANRMAKDEELEKAVDEIDVPMDRLISSVRTPGGDPS